MERNDNSTADPLDELVTALASVTDKQLIREFLQSILTPSEIEEIPKRWALVRLIDEGWSQRKIAAELGLSLCKITRGSRELKKENSAFRRMVNRYKEVASRKR